MRTRHDVLGFTVRRCSSGTAGEHVRARLPFGAHADDCAGGRANEHDALRREAIRKLRVLAEESVSGMDRLECKWE